MTKSKRTKSESLKSKNSDGKSSRSQSTRRTLRASIFAVLICVVMLIGTTFAWFTDTASTAVNKIQAGTLDVGLEVSTDGASWTDAEGQTLSFKKAESGATQEVLWEPGCTYELPTIRVVNNGNLAFKYKLVVSGAVGDTDLLDAIEFTVTDSDGNTTDLKDMEGIIIPKGSVPTTDDEKVQYSDVNGITIKGHMKDDAGNEYQGLSVSGIAVTVYAEQYTYEYDSYNKTYDEKAEGVITNSPFSDYVKVTGNKATGEDTVLTDNETNPTVKATLPADSLDDNVSGLALIKKPTANPANVTVSAGENAVSADVRVIDTATNQVVSAEEGKYFTIGIQLGKVDLVDFYYNGTKLTKSEDTLTEASQYQYDFASGVVTFTASEFDNSSSVFTAKIKYSGGAGTESYPYLMATTSDLSGLAAITNSGTDYSGNTFKMTNDISLNNAAWTPIGEKETNGTKFKGTFDGNDKTISGLNVTADSMSTDHDGYGALFGAIDTGAVVKDLTVNGTVSCKNAAGIVARMNAGKVENCTSNVTVTGTSKAGGIVCLTNSGGCTITNCTNTGTVSCTGSGQSSCSGGIAGLANPKTTIESCTNNGAVGTAGSYHNGGILGYSQGDSANVITISNCSNTMSVTGEVNVGGIVGGAIGNLNIAKSNNSGAVSATTNAGGIVGLLAEYATGTLTSCKNNAAVSGINAGGVVGKMDSGVNCANISPAIINCSGGTATITGTNSKGRLIGFVQYVKLTIDNTNGDSYDSLTAIGKASENSQGNTDNTSICIVSGTLNGDIDGGQPAASLNTHIIIKSGAKWSVNGAERTGTWTKTGSGWVLES